MTKSEVDCLIIDDDKGICSVLENYCENLGIFRNIIIANDGQLGSNKLRNQSFGLILLDINMPKRSGIDVLNDFSSTSPNSVEDVCIVSGELDKAKIATILGAGIKSFIIKPFKEEDFQAKVLPILKKKLAKPASK